MFPMSLTARQLAELVGGELHGDGDLVISAAKPLDEAGPGDITFIDHPKRLAQVTACKAAAVVVPKGLSVPNLTSIAAADPLGAFIGVVQALHGRPADPPSGIDARAVVHPSVKVGVDPSIEALASIGAGTTIGARCRIHPGVVIGRDCKLGDDVVLHPHVVLYDGTVLGDRVIIHATSVIGADGFGYRFHQGKHAKVPQLGTVEIGADVEIGASTTVDRATFGVTRIGAGTKIDNQVQVGHNCRIGAHNILCAQVGIGGSARIGDYVSMGGQAGVKDHVKVGDGAMIAAKSGAIGDVGPKETVFGLPARDVHEQMRLFALIRRLPQMQRELRRLSEALEQTPAKRAG
jgi:UDP-3-O-[3-hydroxymyristoyl] glucosamine N-acyltransferase